MENQTQIQEENTNVTTKPINTFRSRLQSLDTFFIPLLVFGASGLAGSLVDFDHFTEIVSDRLVIGWETLSGRTFHLPYFLIFCVILCCSVAYVHRLHVLVLEEELTKGDD